MLRIFELVNDFHARNDFHNALLTFNVIFKQTVKNRVSTKLNF